MPPFTVVYREAARAGEPLPDGWPLARLRFREPSAAASHSEVDEVALPELGGTATEEIWLSARPVRTGVLEGVGYADNGAALFLRLRSNESAPDDLQPLTARAYRRLFAAARVLGYPHLLRVWNYFPAINQECNGLERYRAFCAGRHQALATERAESETLLPAASAIGARASGLQLHALASREAGIQIENPRQLSAFRYPPQYGPRSPLFSRAVLKAWGERWHLYISGTASIVGHASRHSELMAQLEESLVNLEALLAQANQRTPTPLRLALLRVYCRPEGDPAPLRERITQVFGADLPMLFLRADICRRELLLEIEGLAVSR